MKRPSSKVDSLTESPRRHRRRRKKAVSTIVAIICPEDRTGPRIPTLLREFGQTCTVSSHINWMYYLEAACEKQGCYVADCATGINFSQTHGAKSLVNYIIMFLTYYVPRKFQLKSDDEWREMLAALRTFHNFCVRKRYVKEDAVLMTALHKLRRFCICTIPQRIDELGKENFWNKMENNRRERREGDDDNEIEKVATNSNAQLPVSGGESSVAEKSTNVGQESEQGGDSKEAVIVGGGGVENGSTEVYDEYESVLWDDMPLNVEQVMDDGWVLNSEDRQEDREQSKAFLHLPPDVAKLGMQGMSLSCMQLALRNGVWRPILHDGIFVAHAYPPDDVFYY